MPLPEPESPEYLALIDRLQSLRASLEPRRPRNGKAFRAIKAEIRNVEQGMRDLRIANTQGGYSPQQADRIRVWRASEKQPEIVKFKAPLVMTQDERLRSVQLKYLGRCEACGEAPHQRRDLHDDHDHKTGRYRGVLCRNCNLALGLLDDSPARMEKLARYILRDVGVIDGAP